MADIKEQINELSAFPVILAGGKGERLWPLSRVNYPKQFLNITNENLSLLQSTVIRAKNIPSANALSIICNNDQRLILQEQLISIPNEFNIHVDIKSIFLEPVSRGTCAAITMVATHIAENSRLNKRNDDVMVIMPADHIIGDLNSFYNIISKAIYEASLGKIVTLGVRPTEANTGYGYIVADFSDSEPIEKKSLKVRKFIEKPNREEAENLININKSLWNSGIFIMSATKYLEEVRKYNLNTFINIKNAWLKNKYTNQYIIIDKSEYSKCENLSIDKSIIEKTEIAVVMQTDFSWNDIGSWDSVWNVLPKDLDGNRTEGDVFISNSTNNLIYSTNRQVTAIGVSDLIVIETQDAILISAKNKSNQIKDILTYFSNSGRKEHLEHVRVHRPWGWYEKISSGKGYCVKKIMVKVGHKLSLQFHHHRSEHWTIISGKALVTKGKEEIILSINESTYINIGEIHRLENYGKEPLFIIEIQIGDTIDEDDIIRVDDMYDRVRIQ